jgi:hypothetical protein
MWNYREISPHMAIMFLVADSPSFALPVAASCVSFTLIGLLSKEAVQYAYWLGASASAWTQRMFSGPQSLSFYYICLLSSFFFFFWKLKDGL